MRALIALGALDAAIRMGQVEVQRVAWLAEECERGIARAALEAD